jgi:hypothetical protein
VIGARGNRLKISAGMPFERRTQAFRRGDRAFAHCASTQERDTHSMTIHPSNHEREGFADSLPCFVLTRDGTEAVSIRDASYLGVSAKVRTAPPLRSLVKLRIELPAGRLVVHAVVMRINRATASGGADLSLRFFMLNGDARAAWDAYISTVAKPLAVAA